MNRIATFLTALGVIAGCTEYEITEDKDVQKDLDEDGVPDILVDPTTIDFGDVYVDGVKGAAPPDEVTEVVTITNEGDVDLHIAEIELDSDGGPYTLGTITSVLIQPGGTAQFTVTFHPLTANAASGKVYINSDDPDESVVEVDLLGTGIAPIIDVSPDDYDFGTLYIGCDALQPITIANIGNAELIVSDMEFATGSTDLEFDDATDVNGSLPWTIEPETSVEVYVAYVPYDEYEDKSWLSITSNDPYTPSVMAKQQGIGALYGENTDLFEQPLKGMTDIVFAVDRSCSMSDDITNVQNNFDVYVNTMASLDADFHVIATVEDNGCINGSDLYIDSTYSASDAQTVITTMINLGVSYGSNTERAFMLEEAFLAEVGSGGCNEGSLRDEATLNLVGVSDEPEQSVNNYAYYVALFQSLKDNPDDVIFHAIGGDYPSGCGTASAYTGYYEAVVATGGIFLSICATDWGSHLEALAEGSTADLSTFELTDWPVPDTIEVRIDGVQTSVGWEYTSSTNSIDFETDYIPEGGSTIEVSYALYGDCDQ